MPPELQSRGHENGQQNKNINLPVPGHKITKKMVANSKKTISTRVTPEVEEFLADQYGSASAGLAACANLMHQVNGNGTSGTSIMGYDVVENLSVLEKIRQFSAREIKGTFNKKEWFFLADSLNGSIIDSTFRCSAVALVAHCEDAELYEGTATKYAINLPELIGKVRKLTGAQVDAVYTHVEKFWNTDDRDLDAWANEL